MSGDKGKKMQGQVGARESLESDLLREPLDRSTAENRKADRFAHFLTVVRTRPGGMLEEILLRNERRSPEKILAGSLVLEDVESALDGNDWEQLADVLIATRKENKEARREALEREHMLRDKEIELERARLTWALNPPKAAATAQVETRAEFVPPELTAVSMSGIPEDFVVWDKDQRGQFISAARSDAVRKSSLTTQWNTLLKERGAELPIGIGNGAKLEKILKAAVSLWNSGSESTPGFLIGSESMKATLMGHFKDEKGKAKFQPSDWSWEHIDPRNFVAWMWREFIDKHRTAKTQASFVWGADATKLDIKLRDRGDASTEIVVTQWNKNKKLLWRQAGFEVDNIQKEHLLTLVTEFIVDWGYLSQMLKTAILSQGKEASAYEDEEKEDDEWVRECRIKNFADLEIVLEHLTTVLRKSVFALTLALGDEETEEPKHKPKAGGTPKGDTKKVDPSSSTKKGTGQEESNEKPPRRFAKDYKKHDPFIKEWLQTKDKSGVTPCRYTADIGGGDICSRADCKFSHARAMTLCTHCLKMGHFWKECTDRKAGKAAAAFPKPT